MSNNALISVVCGLLGLIFIKWFGVGAIILGAIGVYYGIKAMRMNESRILRFVGLALAWVNLLFGLVCAASLIYSIIWVHSSDIPRYRI